MAGPGRKKMPREVKVIRGTFRKDREAPDSPPASVGEMVFPSWLPSGALKHFETLKSKVAEYGISSPSYTEALAMAAMRMYEIECLTIDIESEGSVISRIDRDGCEIKKANPSVSQRNDAMRHLQSLLCEFGLTPAAIQKVGKTKPKQDNPFGAFG